MTTLQNQHFRHALQCVEQIYGVPSEAIISHGKPEPVALARCAVVLIAYEVQALPTQAIAEASNRTRDGINKCLRAARRLRSTSKRWRDQYHTAVALMGQGRSVCACCRGLGVVVEGKGIE